MVGGLLASCTIDEDHILYPIVKRAVINPVEATVVTQIQADYCDCPEKHQPLYDMLDEFVSDAASHGIDLNYVYDGRITLLFGDWNDSFMSGISYDKGNDGSITIYIHERAWNRKSEIKRKYLFYHELGHDIFNLKHRGPRLMHPGTGSLPNDEADAIFAEFWEHVKNH